MAQAEEQPKTNPQAEDLTRLIETEARLAARLDQARRESRAIIEAAHSEAAQNQSRAREAEAEERQRVEARVSADLSAALTGVAEAGRQRLQRLVTVSEEEAKQLARYIVTRLLEDSASPGEPHP